MKTALPFIKENKQTRKKKNKHRDNPKQWQQQPKLESHINKHANNSKNNKSNKKTEKEKTNKQNNNNNINKINNNSNNNNKLMK